MEIPRTKQLCQAERWVEGLRLLAKECQMSSIRYCALGVTRFEFADGSSIGDMRSYIEAGIIDGETFHQQYGK